MRAHEIFLNSLSSAVVHEEAYPRFPDGLSRDEACVLQNELVKRVIDARDSTLAGFKAGVTTANAQRALGLDGPLLGQLYAHGHYQPGAELAFHPKRVIECEIALVVAADGTPTAIAAALEFVLPNFSQGLDGTANNLIAANLVAEGFMLGPLVAWPSSDARLQEAGPEFSLSRDREPLNSGRAFESLDGPGRALDWMLREAKQRALPLADGMILLTGNCGAPVPAQPGHYRADYGALGAVEFIVAPAS